MSNKLFNQQPLILASSSKSRLALMKSLGLDFQIVPAHCDENQLKKKFNASTSLVELAALLARTKALDVSARFPDHFVIAADQLCIIGNTYLDKPLSHDTAVTHLRLLRGKTHQQMAAFCIAKAGAILWQEQDIAHLTMHYLSDGQIENYLKAEKPYQSCGAYHYEGLAKWLFKAVQGSDSTILGLPLLPLTHALSQLKVICWN